MFKFMGKIFVFLFVAFVCMIAGALMHLPPLVGMALSVGFGVWGASKA